MFQMGLCHFQSFFQLAWLFSSLSIHFDFCSVIIALTFSHVSIHVRVENMKTANNLMFRCGSAFTSHVTYFKIYRCKCNSKGESSALVSTLTLSPPEVPDLAFTPVSHLLLKAMGTSSHLPHYGVNVYTDRHSQPRLRDYSQGKYSPYKTHTRNSATPWGLNSKS